MGIQPNEQKPQEEQQLEIGDGKKYPIGVTEPGFIDEQGGSITIHSGTYFPETGEVRFYGDANGVHFVTMP